MGLSDIIVCLCHQSEEERGVLAAPLPAEPTGPGDRGRRLPRNMARGKGAYGAFGKPPFRPRLLAIATMGVLSLTALPVARAGAPVSSASAPTDNTTAVGPSPRKGADTHPTHEVSDHGPINIGEVSRSSRRRNRAAKALRESPENEIRITRQQIRDVVPPGGSIVTALGEALGVQVKGYGSGNGASRYQIRINGIQVGFALAPGNPEKNGLSVLFDGVPMNNPLAQYDGWESSETPISSIFANIHATQGPGNPDHRWYDSMGGTVNLIPVEPGRHAGASVDLGGGSFASYSASTMLQTGRLDGWRSELGGGYTRSDGFRTGPYHAPNQAEAFFAKTIKDFRTGRFSAGFFFSHTQESRPLYIPADPIPGVTTGGYEKPGELLSQSTTGFYDTVPTSLYFKNDVAHMYLVYARLFVHLDKHMAVTNTLYFRHGYRHHYRANNYFPHTVNTESFSGTTRTVGDRLAFRWVLPINTVRFGGYYQHTRYQSLYDGYNPAVLQSSVNDPLFEADYFDRWDGAAAFVQDEIHPVPGLRITPGLQLINYRLSFTNNSEAAVPPGSSPLTFKAGNNDNSYSELAPSLGINDRILAGLHAFAVWARNFQTAPAAAYGNYQKATVEVPTSPTRINSYIGGLKWQTGAWGAEISAFHQHLGNAVIATFLPSDLISKLDRVSAVYNGVNILVRYGKNLGWFAGTRDTIQHAYYPRYLPAGGTPVIDARIPGAPTLILGFDTGYRWFVTNTRFGLRLDDQYASSVTTFNNNTNLPDPDRLPDSSYNLVNLGFSADTLAFDHAVRGLQDVDFSLMIDNLLNRKYNSQGYITSGGEYGPNSQGALLVIPGAPRAVYASVSASF